MELHKYNICYLTSIIFMIPLIVIPSLILMINIKTSNLENIIKYSEEHPPNVIILLIVLFIIKIQMKDIYLWIHI